MAPRGGIQEIESLDEELLNRPTLFHYRPDQVYLEAGRPDNMRCHHWHSHVELNLPLGDGVTYLINGREFRLPAGHLGLFWAAMPHRLTERGDCHRMLLVYVPIQMFLNWTLDDAVTGDLMGGAVLASRKPYGLAVDQFETWLQDFRGRGEGGHDPRLGKVQQMLEFIAAHYDQPITAGEVAAVAELHPHYAMGQFKKVLRTSIKQYINGLRINQAKALLADTDRPILDIALAVGFGSSSRFYEVFQRQLEMTPSAYRKRFRGIGGSP
ncbi:helix-turn-helix domain-containing protein [Halomonas sp. BM-2019]|uniref:helix-turn-helix domain-containing protein n=1 Tax=Halomonas sp. BM-2019 TaxID=2811227 RepID=UPI001B3C2A73|nr:MAG: helix-turn-helix domain-containing protein [Halomonas sp. BM-2019]